MFINMQYMYTVYRSHAGVSGIVISLSLGLLLWVMWLAKLQNMTLVQILVWFCNKTVVFYLVFWLQRYKLHLHGRPTRTLLFENKLPWLRVLNKKGIGKIGYFQPIGRCISQTVQVRARSLIKSPTSHCMVG